MHTTPEGKSRIVTRKTGAPACHVASVILRFATFSHLIFHQPYLPSLKSIP